MPQHGEPHTGTGILIPRSWRPISVRSRSGNQNASPRVWLAMLGVRALTISLGASYACAMHPVVSIGLVLLTALLWFRLYGSMLSRSVGAERRGGVPGAEADAENPPRKTGSGRAPGSYAQTGVAFRLRLKVSRNVVRGPEYRGCSRAGTHRASVLPWSVEDPETPPKNRARGAAPQLEALDMGLDLEHPYSMRVELQPGGRPSCGPSPKRRHRDRLPLGTAQILKHFSGILQGPSGQSRSGL